MRSDSPIQYLKSYLIGMLKGRKLFVAQYQTRIHGKLIIKQKLYLGFLSNSNGLHPNLKGVFFLGPEGKLEVRGHVNISKGGRIYVRGILTIGHGYFYQPSVHDFL